MGEKVGVPSSCRETRQPRRSGAVVGPRLFGTGRFDVVLSLRDPLREVGEVGCGMVEPPLFAFQTVDQNALVARVLLAEQLQGRQPAFGNDIRKNLPLSPVEK